MSAKFCVCFLNEREGWGIIAALSEGRFKLMCAGCTEKGAEEMVALLNQRETKSGRRPLTP